MADIPSGAPLHYSTIETPLEFPEVLDRSISMEHSLEAFMRASAQGGENRHKLVLLGMKDYSNDGSVAVRWIRADGSVSQSRQFFVTVDPTLYAQTSEGSDPATPDLMWERRRHWTNMVWSREMIMLCTHAPAGPHKERLAITLARNPLNAPAVVPEVVATLTADNRPHSLE